MKSIREKGKRWLVSGFSIGSLFVVIIPFGLTNFLFLDEAGDMYRLGTIYLGNKMYFWLSKTSFWVVLSLFAIWIGYSNNRFAYRIYHFVTKVLFKKFPFRRLEEPRLNSLLFLYIGILGIRIFAINAGIYGYTGGNTETHLELMQIISLLNGFPKLIIFLVAYRYFTYGTKKNASLLYAVLCIEIFFGLLSGFKSQLVFPVLIVFIAYLISMGSFKYSYLMLTIGLIIAAYTLVEPMRAGFANYYAKTNKIPTSIEEILALSRFDTERAIESDRTIFDAFADRNHITIFSAIAFKHYHEQGILSELESPKKLLMSPLIAIIPRALWIGEKPIANEGNILYHELLGRTGETSITSGYIGSTILGFGSTIIILLFSFMFGVYLRYLDFFYVAGGGAILLFIVCLPEIISFNSLHNLIISFFRMTPIYFLLQYMILKPSKMIGK